MSTLKTATWSVRFTLPKGDPQGEANWAKNATIVCVCDDIDTAIRLVRAEHPAAAVYQVNHKGNDFTLFDPKIARPTLIDAALLPNGKAQSDE